MPCCLLATGSLTTTGSTAGTGSMYACLVTGSVGRRMLGTTCLMNVDPGSSSTTPPPRQPPAKALGPPPRQPPTDRFALPPLLLHSDRLGIVVSETEHCSAPSRLIGPELCARLRRALPRLPSAGRVSVRTRLGLCCRPWTMLQSSNRLGVLARDAAGMTTLDRVEHSVALSVRQEPS